MIILDTNVVSEAMAPSPNSMVARWLADQEETNLFITSVTEAELRYGAELLPHGRRRTDLEHRINRILIGCFGERILPFDSEAAGIYASVRANRLKSGFSVGVEDTMILGIAKSQGAAVATRNVEDFVGSGVKVVNPWEDSR